MATPTSSEPQLPPAPELLEPQSGAVVEASSVVFSWRPVAGALRYRLEVASDSAFEKLLFDAEVEGNTSITVFDHFQPDEQLHYWRVMAQNAAGWSNADRVESFIAASHERSLQTSGVPDESEEFGPAAAIMRSSAMGIGAEVSGDEDLYDEEAEEGVEHDRVAIGQIMGIALGILAALVVIIVLIFQWTGMRARQAEQAAVGASGYPELRDNRARAQQLLSEYGVVEGGQGSYRIPIERAIDLMVTESYQTTNPAPSQELRSPAGN